METAFLIFVIFAISAQTLLLILFFFEPALAYKIRKPPTIPVESEEFVRMLEALANAQVHPKCKVDVLTNGESFYEAELEAISKAKKNINLEAYIFQRGKLTKRFVKALAERARAGVQVNMVLDAIGSFATFNSYLKDVIDAGGKVAFYHPLRLHVLPRFNNRTHRELLIIDGSTAFIGGAGFADHWIYNKKKAKRWRDTMCRVQGEAVLSLQSIFAENWLEASGEILVGRDYFPVCETDDSCCVEAMVVGSSPSAGRSTRARILYQTLMSAAKESIYITTPYFLPDRSIRDELVRAVKERNVDVRVIIPGKHSDHLLTRRSSQRLFGELLEAGVKIYEYEPAMIHTKSLIIDRAWSAVGSTNFDNRSFGLNDEVNLVGIDSGLANRLYDDFYHDLSQSHQVSLKQWRRRSIVERVHELFGWVLERQQ